MKAGKTAVRIAIIVPVLVLGCLALYYIYNPKKAVKLILPDLDEISYANIKVQKGMALANAYLVVENTKPYKLTIDSVCILVRLSGNRIIEEKIALDIDLSKYDSDTIKVPLHLAIKKIRKLLHSLHTDSTPVSAEGYIIYNTFLGRVKLDFDKTKMIPVPVPPVFKVEKIEYRKYRQRGRSLEADVYIRVINKGKNLDLRLDDVDYELCADKTLFTQGVIKGPVDIKPQSDTLIKETAIFHLDHPLRTIWKIMVDDDQIPYTLRLHSEVNENKTGKLYMTPVDLTAQGMMELKK